MLKVDLITGFLGAGKTTFLQKYLRYLKQKGLKVALIENEFGGADADSRMLQAEDIPISSLTGVCMCCKGKTMFQNMILNAAHEGYDRILVEPSGIYDVDEFFASMMDRDLAACSQIGSIITIVDARMDAALSEQARYLFFSQILAAGRILLSKVQLVTAAEVENTVSRMNELLRHYGSDRVLTEADYLAKDWSLLTDEDMERLTEAGSCMLEHERESLDHSALFQALTYAGYCVDRQDLEQRIRSLFADRSHGEVYRVKGHIRDLSGNWYEMNCTRDSFSVRPVQIKRGLFVIIGQELDAAWMDRAFLDRETARRVASGDL